MLNEGNFREKLLDMVNNPNSYTKEQLYDAFLEITERYLDEMASTLNFERAIIAKYGEEKGNEEIERIVASNPALADLEQANSNEENRRDAIFNLLAYIECEFGFDIGNRGTDE